MDRWTIKLETAQILNQATVQIMDRKFSHSTTAQDLNTHQVGGDGGVSCGMNLKNTN
jgi:hypothetical protein